MVPYSPYSYTSNYLGPYSTLWRRDNNDIRSKAAGVLLLVKLPLDSSYLEPVKIIQSLPGLDAPDGSPAPRSPNIGSVENQQTIRVVKPM